VRRSALACAAGLLACLTGCATIPVDGPVEAAGDVGTGEQQPDPYVRVFARPPAGGETPTQIVNGFLEATGSVEPGYAVARSYLAPTVSGSWDPGARITVYDHPGATVTEEGGGTQLLSAPAVGSVDYQGVFTPAGPSEEVRARFRLAKVKGQWRIADPPTGIYISAQDFAREYRRVYLYYPAPEGQVLVSDPVFLPVRSGLATALVRSLLRGPTRWLAPAVRTAFPANSMLAREVRVEGGTADVQLSSGAAPRDETVRERLVAQLVWTLSQVPGVTSVRVSAGGQPLDVRSHGQPYVLAQWRVFEGVEARQEQDGYFVFGDRVWTPIGAGGRALFGRFGDGRETVYEVAASPDAELVGVVTADRTRVVTAGKTALERVTERMTGAALHSPSYDQFGNLWVVEGDSPRPVLWLLRPSGGRQTRIEAPELGDRSVRRLRVAGDGTRVALITERAGRRELLIGRVQGSGERIALTGLRVVAHLLLNPRDLAWESHDRVVVVAEERRAQRQPYFVTVDGAEIQPGEPLVAIDTIAAAPGQPLVAATEDGRIWELRPGGPWVVVGKGVRPVYPG